MRIDLNPAMPQAVDSGPSAKPAFNSSSGTAGRGSIADVADLSTDYVRVQALATAVSQLPEIRQDKVAALAEKVRSGNYAVTSEQTAEALLSDMTGRAAA
jgi:anti-sigma28 factor (negative regulator of flagellin synthesis)